MRPELKTSQTVAIVAAVVVALAVSLLVPIGTTGNGGTSPLPTEVAAVGADGLQLSLRLNASTINAGQSIGIGVTLFNTLDSTYNASASSNWPFEGQTQACGNQIYPFGVAIFQGQYGSGNVTQGTPLSIFAPVACPLAIRFISGYFFQPNSDSALILPGSGQTTQMTANITVGRVYTSISQSHGLTPGTYTIAAVDEWGLAVFLYVHVR